MKTICVITGYRSDYTKLKSVLLSIKKHENLNLKIIVFGAHTLENCGETYQQIIEDGFAVEEVLSTNIQGNNTDAMVKSIGVGLMEISSVLNKMKPDITLIVGDRYEIISAAIASSVNNIPVAHIQGGEISGTIDEVLRHSITKLSHVHFPSTDKSAKRIIKMGEDPSNVYNVGCPAVDYILSQEYLNGKQMNVHHDYKSFNLNFEKDYAVLIQHPVTTEYKKSNQQMTTTLESLQHANIPSILLWPNPDTGALGVVKAVRKFEEKYGPSSILFDKIKNLPFNVYLNILKNCKFIIGNSSSGIREAHIFNVPAINIGTRQNGRERTNNIIDVPHYKKDILNAITNIENFRLSSKNIYGSGKAGKKIADILNSIDYSSLLNKRFYD